MPMSPTPFGDQTDDLVGQAFFEIDADVGMGRQERRQRLRQEFGQRIGVGEHPHLPGQSAGVAAQVLPQPLRLRQHDAGMLQQGAPRLSRRHPVPAPHQERRA